MKLIPYTKALITKKDIISVNTAMKKGWGKNHNLYIQMFEKNFKKKMRTKYAIATSSCTGAIMIGLMSLGIKKNDEVILSDTNWISPATCISQLGAKCIFADIDENTWCINPDSIEKKITKKTKAIIATHLYGNLCDMQRILQIGKKYKIPILEDAAEAIGSKYRKKYAGTIGLMGFFSFHGTKTITTGEGGMIITNERNIYEKALTISNLGREEKNISEFRPVLNGLKFKMSNIQAALGISQLKRLNFIVKKKINIFNQYKKRLNKLDLHMNHNDKKNVNSYWMPTVVFKKKYKIRKKEIFKLFRKNKITTRPFFIPLSSLKMYKKVNNFNSYDIASRAINLPSYLSMRKSDIDRVCQTIKKIIRK